VASFVGEALASPAVLIADLCHRERTLTRRWLAAYLVLTAVISAVGWGFVFLYRSQVEATWGVLKRYGEIAVELGSTPFAADIRLFAAEQDLDPALVASVIRVESDFRPEAVSRKGARGLMQLRPATWRELRPSSPCPGTHDPPSCGEDCIFAPGANVRAGCRYLRRLLDELGGNFVAAFAAYNAGASAVRALGPEEVPIPPFPETEHYVRQVLAYWSDLRARSQGSSPVARLSYPGRVSFVAPAAGVGLWVLLLVWLAVKGRRLDWDSLL
jgi:hypothetical protein